MEKGNRRLAEEVSLIWYFPSRWNAIKKTCLLPLYFAYVWLCQRSCLSDFLGEVSGTFIPFRCFYVHCGVSRTRDCKWKGGLCWLVFCVIAVCGCPFPKMTCNFLAQLRLFFKRITFSRFAERDAHCQKCKLEFLEKKHQILILICKVVIYCSFLEWDISQSG